MNVELYVQVIPVWHRWMFDVVDDVKIAKITRTRPEGSTRVPGARTVKVVLDVPAEQFLMQAVEVQAPELPAIRAVS